MRMIIPMMPIKKKRRRREKRKKRENKKRKGWIEKRCVCAKTYREREM